MRLYIQKAQEHKNIKWSGTVLELLQKLKINPQTVIVTKNGILVIEEDRLEGADDVEILQVVSGG